MNLFEKACRQALLDLYFDLAACNNLIKKYPDWDWLVVKKAELEAKERELVKELSWTKHRRARETLETAKLLVYKEVIGVTIKW